MNYLFFKEISFRNQSILRIEESIEWVVFLFLPTMLYNFNGKGISIFRHRIINLFMQCVLSRQR